MSKISKKTKEKHLRSFGDHHHNFLSRITKTLYYGKLPKNDRLSLPVTELATELFSEGKKGRSLERLHYNDAALITRNACVSPCSFILAVLYLERLKTCNPEYLQRINPSELFLVSLMVSSKFLFEDGEEDEVFIDEWAISGGLSIKELVQLEKEFLNAMNWEIFVSETKFWKKLNEIEQTIAKREGINRGWFTYTELNNILGSVEAYHLYQYIASVVVVLLATYTAGIITLISSMYIVSQIPGNSLQPAHTTPTETEGNDTFIPISYCKKCPHIADASDEIIENTENLKCLTIKEETFQKKQIDVIDVLKTSLILASIKSVPFNDSNKSIYTDDLIEDNTEGISWDWWTNPTMAWLTTISDLPQNFDFMPNFRNYVYVYSDSNVVTAKMIEQEDHVHKATRTRIQDQLERSWHKEWTDTIKTSLFYYETPLLQNLKT